MKQMFLTIAIIFVGLLLINGCVKKGERKRSVRDVQNVLKDKFEPVYQNHLKNIGLNETPDQFTFITLKAEKQLELWFVKGAKTYFVKSYPILAASGVAGPKLKEGDLQVPEGFYKISWLNPNSDLHLSLQVNYPNDFDKKNAQQEGRTQLGGDIFVHGKAMSLGCVAIGDDAIEEVFYMCSKIGIKNSVFLSMPHDFRKKAIVPQDKIWLNELYQQLSEHVRKTYIHS
jgi:murein L,D-transpeptidase YafK